MTAGRAMNKDLIEGCVVPYRDQAKGVKSCTNWENRSQPNKKRAAMRARYRVTTVMRGTAVPGTGNTKHLSARVKKEKISTCCGKELGRNGTF